MSVEWHTKHSFWGKANRFCSDSGRRVPRSNGSTQSYRQTTRRPHQGMGDDGAEHAVIFVRRDFHRFLDVPLISPRRLFNPLVLEALMGRVAAVVGRGYYSEFGGASAGDGREPAHAPAEGEHEHHAEEERGRQRPHQDFEGAGGGGRAGEEATRLDALPVARAHRGEAPEDEEHLLVRRSVGERDRAAAATDVGPLDETAIGVKDAVAKDPDAEGADLLERSRGGLTRGSCRSRCSGHRPRRSRTPSRAGARGRSRGSR